MLRRLPLLSKILLVMLGCSGFYDDTEGGNTVFLLCVIVGEFSSSALLKNAYHIWNLDFRVCWN